MIKKTKFAAPTHAQKNQIKTFALRRSLNRTCVASVGFAGMMLGQAYGQQIAILDTGVDPNRGFNTVGGFNYFLNTDDTSDVSDLEPEGHGTVSVRVASEAFNGEIVPFVITNGDTSQDATTENMVRSARDSALSDILGQDSIRAVGITWGTSGVVGSSAPLISDLSRANKVIAIMAGNESASQPNVLATSSFNLSGVIIVGATDASGELLPESNRAGTTAQRFVAAIGLPDADAVLGDTSWATARITGIAGAVLAQNPDLTAEEVAQVIFDSAEDRGAEGTDAEFGRGVILSAEQVLNNVIGTPTVPTPAPMPAPAPAPAPPTDSGGGGGGGGGGGAAILLIGGALAGALFLGRRSNTKLEKTLVLDSYGRTFQVDLSDDIVVNDADLELSNFFNSLEQDSVAGQFQLPGLKTNISFSANSLKDPRIDFIEYFATPGDRGTERRHNSVSFATNSRLSDHVSLSSGYQVSAQQEFGGLSLLPVESEFGRSSFISGQSFTSVLSGFSPQANTASLALHSKSNIANGLKFGLVSVDGDNAFSQHSLSSFLQGSYQINERTGLSIQFGQIRETGSVLGGASEGIFSVDQSTTYAINLAGKIRLAEQFSLVSNYGIGRTDVDAAQNSLLADFSTLRSDWYGLGLIGDNVLRSRDQLGISVSQPLKVQSGAVNYSIPTGRLASGDIGFDTERINLGDTNATERNIEAYYRTMLNDRFELGAFAQYRRNPNHVRDHGDDMILMATIKYRPKL